MKSNARKREMFLFIEILFCYPLRGAAVMQCCPARGTKANS
jgi:hypothetical protein